MDDPCRAKGQVDPPRGQSRHVWAVRSWPWADPRPVSPSAAFDSIRGGGGVPRPAGRRWRGTRGRPTNLGAGGGGGQIKGHVFSFPGPGLFSQTKGKIGTFCPRVSMSCQASTSRSPAQLPRRRLDCLRGSQGGSHRDGDSGWQPESRCGTGEVFELRSDVWVGWTTHGLFCFVVSMSSSFRSALSYFRCATRVLRGASSPRDEQCCRASRGRGAAEIFR